MRLPFVIAIACYLLGCGISECPVPAAAQVQQLPSRLSEIALFADFSARVVAREVMPYRPRFSLYSDDLSKERWIRLPGVIDARDMDDWSFPVGTQFFKQFSSNGVVLETRVLQRIGEAPEDWVAAAYVWNGSQSEAYRAEEGARDVLDSDHDVPSSGQCFACHGGSKSRVLGFSAVQLEPSATAWLAAEGRLDPAPAQPVEVPGSKLDQQALGYLHANCGTCHNARRPPSGALRCYDPRKTLNLRLELNRMQSVADTGAYEALGLTGTVLGRPETSRLVGKMHSVLLPMPPLAADRVDRAGVSLISDWIRSLR